MKINLLLLSMLVIGCTSDKRLIKLDSEIWNSEYSKQDFKDNVLCNCLVMGFGDKNVTQQFKEEDRSFYSPIHIVFFDSVSKVILRPVVLKIKRDSVESLTRVSEAAAGKRVFYECLAFYKSRKLDSISDSEIKKWEKIKNIDSIINIRMPAF